MCMSLSTATYFIFARVLEIVRVLLCVFPETSINDISVFVTGNLKRRLGRARGFVLRMFDALCNCTQTAAAAARTTARNNPFTKR